MKTAVIMLICIGALASLIAAVLPNEDFTGDQGAYVGLALILFGSLIYFLPAIVAQGRQSGVAIFLLNLLLGWTFIGWVAALVGQPQLQGGDNVRT